MSIVIIKPISIPLGPLAGGGGRPDRSGSLVSSVDTIDQSAFRSSSLEVVRERHHLQVESILNDVQHQQTSRTQTPTLTTHPLSRPAINPPQTSSYGIQNRYPRFHHHCSPLCAAGPAERACLEGRDQAKPRAYGAFKSSPRRASCARQPEGGHGGAK